MQKYQNNVTNRNGDAAAGVSVLITTGGATATIYSDNGLTVVSNPLTTDANGYFEFYAADGRYNISVANAGGYSDVLIADTLLVLGQASNYATAAFSSASAATAQAALAATANTEAQAARDDASDSSTAAANSALAADVSAAASLAAGNKYTTTAQGLAATTNGQYFLLRTADLQVFDVYLNNAGVAVLVGQMTVSSATDTANLKYQYTFAPPVNIYNPALAEDQFIYNNSNGAKAANSGGAATGLIPVQEGNYYTLTQPSPERGFFQNIYAFGAAGAYKGLASPIGGNPVCAGMNPVYSDPVVTSGYRRITVYIPPGSGVTHIATWLIYALVAHTTDDFNRIRNGVQVEVGSVPTFFRPYNVSIGTSKEFSLPPPNFNRGPLSVTKAGSTFYVRGSFDDTRDIVQQVLLAAGSNNTLNAQGAKTCLKTETDNALAWANGTALDVQNDSTAPLQYNGTYIGGNHGANIVQQVTATAHGKTVVDVGSEWVDALPRKWYLMQVIDASTLWFVSENIAPNPAIAPQWVFSTTFTGVTLTHVTGATHTGAVTIGGSATTQLYPSIQGETVTVLLDSTKPITVDGTYYGTTVDFVDKYNIANPQSVVTYVRSLVGSVTQPSFIDPSIGADVQRALTYRYAENGSCTIYDSEFFINPVNFGGYLGGTQAQALTFTGKQLWQYVPRTLPVSGYDLQATANISGAIPTLGLVSGLWSDANNPPDRMTQIVKSSGGVPEYNLTVGYSPIRSIGTPAVRKTVINSAGFIFTGTRKQYPQAVTLGPLAAGTCFDIVAFRAYGATTTNPQATVCTWYREGNSVIVIADFHQNVQRSSLKVPQQFTGMDITVVDKTASLTVHGNGVVTSDGVLVTVAGTGYGYVVLKLS